MENLLTRFLGGQFLNDPLVAKLLLLIIFFLGASQAVRIIHSFWKTGKLKIQEKQVSEDKGKWLETMKSVLIEFKKRNERADKIYDKVAWLYEIHHKFDDDGVPIWYVRKSVDKAIEKLADNIETQTKIMSRIWEDMKDVKRDMERVEATVERSHR